MGVKKKDRNMVYCTFFLCVLRFFPRLGFSQVTDLDYFGEGNPNRGYVRPTFHCAAKNTTSTRRSAGLISPLYNQKHALIPSTAYSSVLNALELIISMSKIRRQK